MAVFLLKGFRKLFIEEREIYPGNASILNYLTNMYFIVVSCFCNAPAMHRWTAKEFHEHPEPGTLDHQWWLVEAFCSAVKVHPSDSLPSAWLDDVRAFFKHMEDCRAARDKQVAAEEAAPMPALCDKSVKKEPGAEAELLPMCDGSLVDSGVILKAGLLGKCRSLLIFIYI